MSIEQENLSLQKYTYLTTVLADKNNKKFYKEMDNLLTQKRFDNAYELSLNENIFNINSFALTINDINASITNFIAISQHRSVFQKRNIFEMVKISNMPNKYIERAITEKKFFDLGEAFRFVSRETDLISFEFLILKILDNFIIKSKFPNIVKEYKKIRTDIFQKIILYSYIPEKKEKETIFLCWIDRLLVAVNNKEISVENYITICNKILKIIDCKQNYVYWKILHAVNYLLLQQEYSTNASLRKYKKIILKQIEENYIILNLSQDELKDKTASILSQEKSNKEDYYYLFDLIKITSERSSDDKLFCLNLCKYIIKQNTQQNIFCFRFVRKYFIETIFKMLKFNDSFNIKEIELQTLLLLFHIDAYFCFNKEEIFKYIVFVLRGMNNGNTKLTLNNFYRYCHIVDYIMSTNSDIKNINIINDLCENNSDKKKISKYFQLSLHPLPIAV